eukprot:TRINITY_DN75614_c0_g1_i1.p1 TRINITY_DN75614_c0_g1~~TRINITY_DN75614_c0_g1_i1.p1  ORF type:complete len:268 (-),score=50.19 TRINITY_DN75614_c0_g1_i1:196-999(-)
MPVSLEDQGRLPPMYTREEVNERQRLEDLREFRKFLVETGSVKCLVKLYKHIAKNELRMDNPQLLKQFLEDFHEESPETQERGRLDRENATLREYNAHLDQQIQDMSQELIKLQRLQIARHLWKGLTLPEFWEANGGAAEDMLTLEQIYRRLVGTEVDPTAGLVLVNLVRPHGLDNDSLAMVVPSTDFIQWVAEGVTDDLRGRLETSMTPRLATPEAPYEAEIIVAVKESGLYPDHLGDVGEVVQLDPTLKEFLEGLAQQFAGVSIM